MTCMAQTGPICASGSIGACSDIRYKRSISNVSNALELVSRLRGVTFDWRTDEFPERKFSEKRQIGFIAQELIDVLPSVVTEDTDGYYSVDYARITPLLVEAIKELKTENNTKEQQIAELQARLETLEKLVTMTLTDANALSHQR